jgi:ATP-dependent Clp protease ATP-binding subunit ClpA/ATP-dependent Clp protease ATP-binding subunit ClpC
VKEFFPPELFNRIDRIVHFAPLSKAVAEQVAQKELAKLLARPGLASRNVFAAVADEVRALAVERAFDVKMGARSIKRWLEEQVGLKLAEALVRGPAAPLRRAEIWVQDGELRVEAQALVTREPVPGRLVLEPLLKANPAEILKALREERARLAALAESEAFAALAEKMRFHLARHEKGGREHADAAYQIDLLRDQLASIASQIDLLIGAPREAAHDLLEAEQFGTIGRASASTGEERVVRILDRRALPRSAPTPSKAQLLEVLAEALFARRVLVKAADLGRHVVTLHLARFGAARSGTGNDFTFIQWLAQAYARGRGTIEVFALRRADGRLVEGKVDAATAKQKIAGAMEEVALRVSGLGVADFWEGEQGLHAWQSLGRLPQMVQVRVLPGDARTPMQLLEDRAGGRAAWQKARAEGGAEAVNPDAPLPMTRIYRFEPPGPSGAATLLEVEDHELGWATSTRGKTAVDVLPELWRLRMSREEA